MVASSLGGDLPSFGSTNYQQAMTTASMSPSFMLGQAVDFPDGHDWGKKRDDALRQLAFAAARPQAQAAQQKQQEKPQVTTNTTRLVKVFIVDPYESVPLKDRLIYRGEEELTDLTDQELFFELDIAGMLAKHNEKRITMVDRRAVSSVHADKPTMLERARVRDLKMQVVNLASF